MMDLPPPPPKRLPGQCFHMNIALLGDSGVGKSLLADRCAAVDNFDRLLRGARSATGDAIYLYGFELARAEPAHPYMLGSGAGSSVVDGGEANSNGGIVDGVAMASSVPISTAALSQQHSGSAEQPASSFSGQLPAITTGNPSVVNSAFTNPFAVNYRSGSIFGQSAAPILSALASRQQQQQQQGANGAVGGGGQRGSVVFTGLQPTLSSSTPPPPPLVAAAHNGHTAPATAATAAIHQHHQPTTAPEPTVINKIIRKDYISNEMVRVSAKEAEAILEAVPEAGRPYVPTESLGMRRVHVNVRGCVDAALHRVFLLDTPGEDDRISVISGLFEKKTLEEGLNGVIIICDPSIDAKYPKPESATARNRRRSSTLYPPRRGGDCVHVDDEGSAAAAAVSKKRGGGTEANANIEAILDDYDRLGLRRPNNNNNINSNAGGGGGRRLSSAGKNRSVGGPFDDASDDGTAGPLDIQLSPNTPTLSSFVEAVASHSRSRRGTAFGDDFVLDTPMGYGGHGIGAISATSSSGTNLLAGTGAGSHSMSPLIPATARPQQQQQQGFHHHIVTTPRKNNNEYHNDGGGNRTDYNGADALLTPQSTVPSSLFGGGSGGGYYGAAGDASVNRHSSVAATANNTSMMTTATTLSSSKSGLGGAGSTTVAYNGASEKAAEAADDIGLAGVFKGRISGKGRPPQPQPHVGGGGGGGLATFTAMSVKTSPSPPARNTGAPFHFPSAAAADGGGYYSSFGNNLSVEQQQRRERELLAKQNASLNDPSAAANAIGNFSTYAANFAARQAAKKREEAAAARGGTGASPSPPNSPSSNSKADVGNGNASFTSSARHVMPSFDHITAQGNDDFTWQPRGGGGIFGASSSANSPTRGASPTYPTRDHPRSSTTHNNAATSTAGGGAGAAAARNGPSTIRAASPNPPNSGGAAWTRGGGSAATSHRFEEDSYVRPPPMTFNSLHGHDPDEDAFGNISPEDAANFTVQSIPPYLNRAMAMLHLCSRNEVPAVVLHVGEPTNPTAYEYMLHRYDGVIFRAVTLKSHESRQTDEDHQKVFLMQARSLVDFVQYVHNFKIESERQLEEEYQSRVKEIERLRSRSYSKRLNEVISRPLEFNYHTDVAAYDELSVTADHILKVRLLGAPASGKTTFLHALLDSHRVMTYTPTEELDVATCIVELKGHTALKDLLRQRAGLPVKDRSGRRRRRGSSMKKIEAAPNNIHSSGNRNGGGRTSADGSFAAFGVTTPLVSSESQQQRGILKNSNANKLGGRMRSASLSIAASDGQSTDDGMSAVHAHCTSPNRRVTLQGYIPFSHNANSAGNNNGSPTPPPFEDDTIGIMESIGRSGGAANRLRNRMNGDGGKVIKSSTMDALGLSARVATNGNANGRAPATPNILGGSGISSAQRSALFMTSPTSTLSASRNGGYIGGGLRSASSSTRPTSRMTNLGSTIGRRSPSSPLHNNATNTTTTTVTNTAKTATESTIDKDILFGSPFYNRSTKLVLEQEALQAGTRSTASAARLNFLGGHSSSSVSPPNGNISATASGSLEGASTSIAAMKKNIDQSTLDVIAATAQGCRSAAGGSEEVDILSDALIGSTVNTAAVLKASDAKAKTTVQELRSKAKAQFRDGPAGHAHGQTQAIDAGKTTWMDSADPLKANGNSPNHHLHFSAEALSQHQQQSVHAMPAFGLVGGDGDDLASNHHGNLSFTQKEGGYGGSTSSRPFLPSANASTVAGGGSAATAAGHMGMGMSTGTAIGFNASTPGTPNGHQYGGGGASSSVGKGSANNSPMRGRQSVAGILRSRNSVFGASPNKRLRQQLLGTASGGGGLGGSTTTPPAMLSRFQQHQHAAAALQRQHSSLDSYMRDRSNAATNNGGDDDGDAPRPMPMYQKPSRFNGDDDDGDYFDDDDDATTSSDDDDLFDGRQFDNDEVHTVLGGAETNTAHLMGKERLRRAKAATELAMRGEVENRDTTVKVTFYDGQKSSAVAALMARHANGLVGSASNSIYNNTVNGGASSTATASGRSPFSRNQTFNDLDGTVSKASLMNTVNSLGGTAAFGMSTESMGHFEGTFSGSAAGAGAPNSPLARKQTTSNAKKSFYGANGAANNALPSTEALRNAKLGSKLPPFNIVILFIDATKGKEGLREAAIAVAEEPTASHVLCILTKSEGTAVASESKIPSAEARRPKKFKRFSIFDSLATKHGRPSVDITMGGQHRSGVGSAGGGSTSLTGGTSQFLATSNLAPEEEITFDEFDDFAGKLNAFSAVVDARDCHRDLIANFITAIVNDEGKLKGRIQRKAFSELEPSRKMALHDSIYNALLERPSDGHVVTITNAEALTSTKNVSTAGTGADTAQQEEQLLLFPFSNLPPKISASSPLTRNRIQNAPRMILPEYPLVTAAPDIATTTTTPQLTIDGPAPTISFTDTTSDAAAGNNAPQVSSTFGTFKPFAFASDEVAPKSALLTASSPAERASRRQSNVTFSTLSGSPLTGSGVVGGARTIPSPFAANNADAPRNSCISAASVDTTRLVSAIGGLPYQPPRSDYALRDLFNEIDLNQDGFIDGADMRALYDTFDRAHLGSFKTAVVGVLERGGRKREAQLLLDANASELELRMARQHEILHGASSLNNALGDSISSPLGHQHQHRSLYGSSGLAAGSSSLGNATGFDGGVGAGGEMSLKAMLEPLNVMLNNTMLMSFSVEHNTAAATNNSMAADRAVLEANNNFSVFLEEENVNAALHAVLAGEGGEHNSNKVPTTTTGGTAVLGESGVCAESGNSPTKSATAPSTNNTTRLVSFIQSPHKSTVLGGNNMGGSGGGGLGGGYFNDTIVLPPLQSTILTAAAEKRRKESALKAEIDTGFESEFEKMLNQNSVTAKRISSAAAASSASAGGGATSAAQSPPSPSSDRAPPRSHLRVVSRLSLQKQTLAGRKKSRVSSAGGGSEDLVSSAATSSSKKNDDQWLTVLMNVRLSFDEFAAIMMSVAKM